MEQRPSFGKSIFILLFILTFIAVAAVLKLTVSFMAPVTIAIMLSFVFYPVVQKMNRLAHIPWVLSIIILFWGTYLLPAHEVFLLEYLATKRALLHCINFFATLLQFPLTKIFHFCLTCGIHST